MRMTRAIGRFWLNVGVALLILMVLEAGARTSISMRKRGETPSGVRAERRYTSDNGVVAPWARVYDRELQSLQAEWHPYVYWRTKPMRGVYITVDNSGRRRTWLHPAMVTTTPLIVFMFGGSTMWGVGARDEFTIPSLVAKTLTKQFGRGVVVVNFGEMGYVSTQEVIALMRELRAGHVPDLVVFYDGVNDTVAAAQGGVAGIPMNEANRMAEFNLRRKLNWREGFAETLALFKVSRWLVRLVRHMPTPNRAASADAALARAVVDRYMGNVQQVEVLARAFRFRAVFFWQPTLFGKEFFSPREHRRYEYAETHGVRVGPFFEEVYSAFARAKQVTPAPHVYDLSGVFDDVPSTVFIDRWHLTEDGNRHVANAMARILQTALSGSDEDWYVGERD